MALYLTGVRKKIDIVRLSKLRSRRFTLSIVWINTDFGRRFVQRKHFCCDTNTSSIEASLVSIFTKRPPFSVESPELQEISSKLTPQVVEAVLKSLGHWRSALLFFEWASHQEGYGHSCYTYNAMAAVLSNARQKAPLRDLVKNMLNSGCYWTPGAFGFFLRCLGSLYLVEEANSSFDTVRMRELCMLNSYSYNCLLEVIAKEGNVSLLEDRLNEMKTLGWPINKHALTPALQCYCNAGKFDKALMILKDLDDKGWVDQHILGILVLSYSKRGEVNRAFELIEWAETKPNLCLNEKTFCVLIHGFSRERRVDKALELYYKMKSFGYHPDISVYDVLIRGLCAEKEIGKALLLHANMKESGIYPDIQIIMQLLSCIPDDKDMIDLFEGNLKDLDAGKRMLLYDSVLNNLVNDRNVGKAYRLLKAIIGSDVDENYQEKRVCLGNEKPPTTWFEMVIDGLCKDGKIDMALELFRDMSRIGCKRSVLLFNNIINCLSTADRSRDCFDLLDEMMTEFQPTHFTFNCILGCLCRSGDAERSLVMLREMRKHGHDPWIKNYVALMKKLCENRKPAEASNFLSNMSREGFHPDMIAYSVVIDGFIFNDELNNGVELFREICERGYCPDLVSYNTIIKGLCKAKRMMDAEEILTEILGKGLVPSIVTYNLLIDGWCKVGDTEQAVVWFSRMIEERKEPNVVTYTTLVDGFCNTGKPDDALRYWKKMEDQRCKPTRIAYMALINGLCKCRMPDTALVYLQKMEEEGMTPDTYIYKALVVAFSFDSNTEGVNKVLEKMTSHVAP